ncbi:hypothetical protein HW555_003787 [Spodoptera exigua]|uniref:polo kinase n=1 Tax=Spodoptera exigua TaxID=7107 RepID=A0A835GPH7_SPOEX|nr:hypothetical protein HW555_003787 [Spodoptera exigua]
MTPKKEEESNDIPEIICDTKNNRSYQRLRYCGKGGFGTCYEIRDTATNKIWAGKILSKKVLARSSQRRRISQEVKIHRSLQHRHVVGFHSAFEDSKYVYIVLEMCKCRSMLELHIRRNTITVPESRYFIHQIFLGVRYLHSKRIIHRDLKPGNIFLDHDLQVKIGDFGLATRFNYDDDRRQRYCGTPNYMAPEILTLEGHSYKADIWSLGIPSSLHQHAASLISLQLQLSPRRRPSVDKLLKHEFLICGNKPTSLPLSCLYTAPRTDHLGWFTTYLLPPRESSASANAQVPTATAVEETPKNDPTQAETPGVEPIKTQEQNINEIRCLLTLLLGEDFKKLKYRYDSLPDELSDPEAHPLVWVSRWVEDSNGFGYHLCDDNIGVLFPDNTKLIIMANGLNVHYVDQQDHESYMTITQYPQELEEKMEKLIYFKKYMTDNLKTTADTDPVKESDAMARLPYVRQVFKTPQAIFIYLNNGTLQLNFNTHTKLIICPKMKAVTQMDMGRIFRTFRFGTIDEHGCDLKLFCNLKYALEQLIGGLA